MTRTARWVALATTYMTAVSLVPIGPVAADPATTTPIKHVIIVIGENTTFDTLFGTYTSPDPKQQVLNLLSEGIVNVDGSPGPSFSIAKQNVGADRNGHYTLQPRRLGPYPFLPQPLRTGILDPATLTFSAPTADTRYSSGMPAGPFQITSSQVKYAASFAAETGDPVHRFFQMWQQTGGANQRHDMFVWVGVTTGIGGSNGAGSPTPQSPQQGGEVMGFFNMAKGDAAMFKAWADTYAIADNYHQGVMGGTGANFFTIATGDAPVYTNAGKLAVPPTNQIENPDPQPATANFYKEDGYSGGSYVNCSDIKQPGVAEIRAYMRAAGIRPNCQPGAYYLLNNYNPPFDLAGNPVLDANNNPLNGPNGKPLTSPFTYPPQTVPTIGEALSAKGVSWRWYTGGRDDADVTSDPLYAAVRPKFPPGPAGDAAAVTALRPAFYNNIGDPLNASANISGKPLHANLRGLTSFFSDVAGGTLPAVSFVVPRNLDSGHPGYSASGKYELFLADLVKRVQAQPAWADTAIIVTTDEGGGYFDSGPIQVVDFFGDGTRIPVIAISPFAKKGYVDHTYYDHVSLLKFIERNWGVPPLSARSRDNLRNPIMSGGAGRFGRINDGGKLDKDEGGRAEEARGYLPTNAPAIGDLMNLFTFGP